MGNPGLYTDICQGGDEFGVWKNEGGESSTLVSCESEGVLCYTLHLLESEGVLCYTLHLVSGGAMLHPTLARV